MDDDPPNSQPQVPVELGRTGGGLGHAGGEQHIRWETPAKGSEKMVVTSNLNLEDMCAPYIVINWLNPGI